MIDRNKGTLSLGGVSKTKWLTDEPEIHWNDSNFDRVLNYLLDSLVARHQSKSVYEKLFYKMNNILL